MLQRLQDAWLYTRPHKCEFFQNSVYFLGHVIGEHGISTQRSKIQAIEEYPLPGNVAELQSFLGMAGWYRKFVPNYAKVAAPLMDLMRDGTPYIWGAAQAEAFKRIKSLLTSTPNLPMIMVLCTDASNKALGGVLMQDGGNGLQPRAYYSRKLKGAELNCPVHDNEMLSVVECIKEWEHHLRRK